MNGFSDASIELVCIELWRAMEPQSALMDACERFEGSSMDTCCRLNVWKTTTAVISWFGEHKDAFFQLGDDVKEKGRN